MRIDKRSGLSRVAFALGLALASGAAQAEQDVLERPALMLSGPRLANAALLDVQIAGQRLLAAGERGLIVWSDDQGRAWQQARVPVTVTLTALTFADAKHGWAVGHSGVVLGTQDGGQSWHKLLDGKAAAQLLLADAKLPGATDSLLKNAERLVADGPDKPFLGVHFSDAAHGMVVGAYGLLLATQDGGASWQSLARRIDNPKGLHLYAIVQDGATFYLFGEQGAVFVSDDRGGTFRALKTPYQGTYFGGLASAGQLLAFGMRGNAYWSADQGQSWHKSTLATANTLTAGRRLASGDIVLVDDGGGVHVSKDGGRRFVDGGERGRTPLAAVAEVSDGQVVVAGARGIRHAALAQVSVESKP